jgi:hypothetical protein
VIRRVVCIADGANQKAAAGGRVQKFRVIPRP